MIVKINDLHPNYFNVNIETNKYFRHKYFSKINRLKYSDIKLMKDYKRIFKKNIRNKWISVNPEAYYDRTTNQLFLRKLLMESIILDPFQPQRDSNMKVTGITKYIYACLIIVGSFALISMLYYMFYLL